MECIFLDNDAKMAQKCGAVSSRSFLVDNISRFTFKISFANQY